MVYKTQFNAKQFYDWVATRDYPVYCSGYLIPDDRFVPIFERSKRLLACMQYKDLHKIEYVYTQRRFAETQPQQLNF